jgi:predicted O-linked N-acetylglucosamine transferase (SPINDLY family)
MGVHVVTLAQRQMAGRQTEAFLQCMGEGGLVAADPDEYVQIAAGLISGRERLADYRSSLRHSMHGSALFDHVRFTSELETALRGMWRKWCEQD